MAERDSAADQADRANGTYGSLRPEAPQASHDANSPKVDLRQQAMDDVKAAQDMAKSQLRDAKHSAEDMAERQKGYAAQQVAGFASAIERVGTELEGGENRDVGRMARQLGETMHRFADDIEGRSMGEIAGMAEDFGRRQPLAFLGLAAIAGLAASRFVSASATRQSASPATSRPAPGIAPSSPPAYAPAASATPDTTGGSNV